jgi:hypothetical protein
LDGLPQTSMQNAEACALSRLLLKVTSNQSGHPICPSHDDDGMWKKNTNPHTQDPRRTTMPSTQEHETCCTVLSQPAGMWRTTRTRRSRTCDTQQIPSPSAGISQRKKGPAEPPRSLLGSSCEEKKWKKEGSAKKVAKPELK